MKDGTVEQFSLWNPEELGHLGAYAAAAPASASASASGQISGAEGEKFKAGELGEYTVGKDGEVIGEPTVFDRKNIDGFDF